MTERAEDRFRQKLRDGLLQSEQSLSPEVLQRLQQARNRAVEAAGHRSGQSRHYWAWAGGFASIALAVVITIQLGNQGLQETMLEDMTMLAAEEELELYQDLDFYDWLAESAPHG